MMRTVLQRAAPLALLALACGAPAPRLPERTIAGPYRLVQRPDSL